MKDLGITIKTLAAITGMFILSACRQNKPAEPEPFRMPKVPVVFVVGDSYLRPDSVDTVMRLDSLAQRMCVYIHTLSQIDYKLWRVDTMQFRHKLNYTDWPTQKHGYYWLIQGLSASSHTKRDKDGLELEIYSRLDEHFLFHPVRQPEKSYDYPFIDYKVMDEYWSSIRADAVGVANPSDGDLFIMAYPIRKHLRGPDQYQKISYTDSIAVPFYQDKVDSSRMICLRVSVMALNN